LRSHKDNELLHKKALVAAKAWVSHYPKTGVIIHTNKCMVMGMEIQVLTQKELEGYIQSILEGERR